MYGSVSLAIIAQVARVQASRVAATVTEVAELHEYLNGVMSRATHHAGAVTEIALALAGAIVWRKDMDQSIRVLAQGGTAKNVLWVYVGGELVRFHTTTTLVQSKCVKARHKARRFMHSVMLLR